MDECKLTEKITWTEFSQSYFTVSDDLNDPDPSLEDIEKRVSKGPFLNDTLPFANLYVARILLHEGEHIHTVPCTSIIMFSFGGSDLEP